MFIGAIGKLTNARGEVHRLVLQRRETVVEYVVADVQAVVLKGYSA